MGLQVCHQCRKEEYCSTFCPDFKTYLKGLLYAHLFVYMFSFWCLGYVNGSKATPHVLQDTDGGGNLLL